MFYFFFGKAKLNVSVWRCGYLAIFGEKFCLWGGLLQVKLLWTATFDSEFIHMYCSRFWNRWDEGRVICTLHVLQWTWAVGTGQSNGLFFLLYELRQVRNLWWFAAEDGRLLVSLRSSGVQRAHPFIRRIVDVANYMRLTRSFGVDGFVSSRRVCFSLFLRFKVGPSTV